MNFQDVESNPEVPGNFYVSVIKDESKNWYPAYGPFKTHQEALESVKKAKDMAYDLDSKTFWYSWGTVKTDLSYNKPGILNVYLD